MEVYIEYALIDNLILNSVILNLNCKLNRIKLKWWKVTLFSLCITIISLLATLVNSYISILINIVSTILSSALILCFAKINSIKKLIIFTFCQVILSYILIGCCFLICLIFKLKYNINNGQVMIQNFPAGLMIITSLCCFVIIKNLINYFISVKQINKFTYKVDFKTNNNHILTTAFLDSGNKIMHNQKPVILINYKLFNKLYPQVKLSDVLLKNYEQICLQNIDEIEVKSIAKTSKIMVFEIENFSILECDKNFNNVVCGLSLTDFEKNLNADCILNPNMFN